MSDQQTTFIFKLRQNIYLEGDITLARMELGAFMPEGVKAINNITEVVNSLPVLQSFSGITALTSHVRKEGIQAYMMYQQSLHLLQQLIPRLSFVQAIYCVTQPTEEAQLFLDNLTQAVGPVMTYYIKKDHLLILAIPHYTLIELSDVIAKRSENASEARQNMYEFLKTLTGRSTNQNSLKFAANILSAQITTSHLSHDIHYYKAKFFPRLVRSTLNICAQHLGNGTHRVIDNFAGSGTTLLEASLLGMQSVGLDIDPLSVAIARAKMEIWQMTSHKFAEQTDHVIQSLNHQSSKQLELFTFSPAVTSHAPLVFPKWLMKNRRMTSDIASTLGKEIDILRTAIAGCEPSARKLFRVFMSDAITRKIRMRFLGTGVGRFSLTFARDSIPQLFMQAVRKYVKTLAVYDVLHDDLNLHFADADVLELDARSLPASFGTFDILVTSPPYLPAASGRESYAMARAPSLIATGLRTYQEVNTLIDDSVGSMSEAAVRIEDLTKNERDTVEWLQQDPLRAIKAMPTARYFLDMRRAFGEMYHILRPGAIAVVVSGKQSTFYEFSTRKLLHVVYSAKLLAEEAQRVGFEVESLLDVKLQKSNRNARPRSLDDYYETLIILRKNSA